MELKLRRTWSDGAGAYSADGIRGTIYVKAGFFGGQAPPATLTLTGLPVAAAPVAAEQPAAEQPAAEQPAAEQVA